MARRREGRDARLLQQSRCGPRHRPAEPRRQDRFATPFMVGALCLYADDRFRRVFGRGEGGRAIHHENRIRAFIAEQRIERGGIAFAGRIADDIDGIAV